MEVYHGGYVEVSQPKIFTDGFTKDFGFGFYCTLIKEQAIKWSLRYNTPIVSIFNYIPNSDLKILEFTSMNDNWLDFIIDSRLGKSHNYDIVIGAMADDQVYNYVSDYIDGVISREQFWALAKFKYPTHQINFATENALNCIKFVKSQNVEKWRK